MELPGTVPYLDWRWDDLVFLVLAGVMLGSALLVVLGRDIIRSALWLILSFAGLAGFYGLLGSPFMAISQVLVYIGAIAVLILFAVMITSSKRGPARLVFQRQWWAGAIAAVLLVGLLIISILLTEWDAGLRSSWPKPRTSCSPCSEDWRLPSSHLASCCRSTPGSRESRRWLRRATSR